MAAQATADSQTSDGLPNSDTPSPGKQAIDTQNIDTQNIDTQDTDTQTTHTQPDATDMTSSSAEVRLPQSVSQQDSQQAQYVDPPVGFWGRQLQRAERWVSRQSTKNNFWHRVCSRIFLPLAYRSGIQFARGEESTFSAVLPFKKFNKNWYNAMAGGALLGNAEVAGGMYVFKKCGADYTVVCKHLEYTFRRPCLGPAVYRIEPRQDIEPLVEAGGEFNITVDMHIVQMVNSKDDKERRVGKSTATFHVMPKAMARARKAKQLDKLNKRGQQKIKAKSSKPIN